MTAETYRFAVWSALILAIAVAAILYQHAQHTAYILSQLNSSAFPFSPNAASSSTLATLSADPANTINSNPGWSGAFSRASGQWTPLGPAGSSIFPNMPAQTWQ